MSTITKTGESAAFAYDGSLPVSVTQTGTLNQTLTYTYNNDFNVTGFTYAGGTSSFGYDNDGLLTSIGGYTITRNAQNGLPTTVAGGGLNIGRIFNGYGEVENQSVTVSSNAVGSWNLTYNLNGQIATKSETVGGMTVNYDYTYDTVGRLTKVEKDGATVEEYGYTNGIRSTEVNTLRGINRSLTYNDEDQLLTAGGVVYQYNDDGFLWTKTDGAAHTTYNYSSRGELLSVTLPDGRNIEHIHDALGRRIAKKVNGTVTEKYLWSGLTQLLAVYDASDNLLMRFEYADARMPFAMTKNGQKYYLAYDQVGSLRAVSNTSGTIVKQITYDTLGNILTDSNPTFTVPFGFAGGLHDRDIGLVRFGFRDYDPQIGRWTAKDPIGFSGGDVDLYSYASFDPVNFIDPSGLQMCEIATTATTVVVLTPVLIELYRRGEQYWNPPLEPIIINYGYDPTNMSSQDPKNYLKPPKNPWWLIPPALYLTGELLKQWPNHNQPFKNDYIPQRLLNDYFKSRIDNFYEYRKKHGGPIYKQEEPYYKTQPPNYGRG